MGHAAITATNGREAVEIAAREKPDVILMDVQMPDLDGFAATTKIREQEKASGMHTPIIAMTAHAMKGDRERCLEAGMDDYVSKPIDLHEFGEKMERLCESKAGHEPTSVWRMDRALERVGGDRRLLQEIIMIFLTESPELMHRIETAVKNQDADALTKAAHTLKGELGYLDIGEAMQIAQKMEEMGRNRELAGAEQAVDELRSVLSGVEVPLRELAETTHEGAHSGG